jgi:hypothetical protein
MSKSCYDCDSQWCALKGTFNRICTGYTKEQIYTTSDKSIVTKSYRNDTSTGFDPDAYKYTSTGTTPCGEPYKSSEVETIP